MEEGYARADTARQLRRLAHYVDGQLGIVDGYKNVHIHFLASL